MNSELEGPFAAGRDRPQGVELVDRFENPVALVYGETKREARAMAAHLADLLNQYGLKVTE